jgi:hypothetical protein
VTVDRQRYGGNLPRRRFCSRCPREVGDASDGRVEKSSQFDARSGNIASYWLAPRQARSKIAPLQKFSLYLSLELSNAILLLLSKLVTEWMAAGT